MKGALIEIEGNWAHFRKPETNNNPLTHDFITKTALIGLIGAVLGIERRYEMRPLFPHLSNALRYGVQILSPVKKESWAFKLRRVGEDEEKPPRPVWMEFLKSPCFKVALALYDEKHVEALSKFEAFIRAVEASEARFAPVLGLHNCPANLRFLSRGEFIEADGEFITRSFVVIPDERHKDGHQKIERVEQDPFRIGIDRVPTHQNDDWWNEEDKYRRVAYPSEGHRISAIGKYYEFSSDNSKWALI